MLLRIMIGKFATGAVLSKPCGTYRTGTEEINHLDLSNALCIDDWAIVVLFQKSLHDI